MRLLHALITRLRAYRQRRAVAENRSLIARVKADAAAMEEMRRLRDRSGRE